MKLPAKTHTMQCHHFDSTRWDYYEPERKVAFVLGDRTRLYLEEEGELWEGRLSEQERLLPDLLAGEASIGDLFETGIVATPLPGGNGAFTLSLVPRSSDNAFEQVTLTLRPPEFGIDAVELLDAAGNRVRYEFFEVRRNVGLPARIFEFEAPPGTEIVAQP